MTKTKKEAFNEWYKNNVGIEFNKKKNKNEVYKIWNQNFRENYDRKEKNIVRNKLINYIKQYKVKSILTLESHKFLFSNKLPECKIIVFEKDEDNFKDMKKSKPDNVKLLFDDIKKASDLNIRIDLVYLDFNRTWYSEKEIVYKLKEVILNSKLFGITLCLHDTMTEKEGDWQFFITKELQEMLGNIKIIYGETYGKGRSIMTTILFEIEV